MLGTWTQRSRHMADEVDGTTDTDRDWLEMDNASTLITTRYDENMAKDLHEYAYREWAGMLGDLYYPRWKVWFDNGMKEPDEGCINGNMTVYEPPKAILTNLSDKPRKS